MREEETKRTSQNSKMQQFFRKRWVFPAIYLVSAALILTAVLWYQALGNGDSANDPIDQGTSYQDEPTQEVNSAVENFAMPAADSDAVSVIRKFYEKDATAAEQEAALVSYNNTYEPSKGIDLAKEDGKEFEVAASLSGTVTKAEKDPLLGNVIEIEHKDGVTTVYQSLASMTVAAGDEVEQNEIIGQAGKSLIQEEDGVHVHFEIRKDGVAVNPLDFMDKPLPSLNDVNVEKEAEPVKEQPVKEEEGTEGEEKGTEQEKEDAEKGTEDKKGAEEDKEKEDAGKEGSEKGNSQDQSEASISTKNA